MKTKVNILIFLASTAGILLFFSAPSHAAMTCEGLFQSEYEMVEGSIQLFGGIGETRAGNVRWDPNTGKVYVRFGSYTGGNADITYLQQGDFFKEIDRSPGFIWSPLDSSLKAATSTKPMTAVEIREAAAQAAADRAVAPSVYGRIRLVDNEGLQTYYKTRWDKASQTLYIRDPLERIVGVYAKEGEKIKAIQPLQGWDFVFDRDLKELMEAPKLEASPMVIGPKTSSEIVMTSKFNGRDVTVYTRWNSYAQTLMIYNSNGEFVARFLKSGDKVLEVSMPKDWSVKEEDILNQMQNYSPRSENSKTIR